MLICANGILGEFRKRAGHSVASDAIRDDAAVRQCDVEVEVYPPNAFVGGLKLGKGHVRFPLENVEPYVVVDVFAGDVLDAGRRRGFEVRA